MTSALLDAGIMAAETRVSMGDDGRAVVLELIADGSSDLRRRFAARWSPRLTRPVSASARRAQRGRCRFQLRAGGHRGVPRQGLRG